MEKIPELKKNNSTKFSGILEDEKDAITPVSGKCQNMQSNKLVNFTELVLRQFFFCLVHNE